LALRAMNEQITPGRLRTPHLQSGKAASPPPHSKTLRASVDVFRLR
jgi:hypothetical protein